MKLANFFILLISFNLISVERDQLDVDFLSDDEYRIDLIFIKYLKDEDLKENFQNPEVNFERFFDLHSSRIFKHLLMEFSKSFSLTEPSIE